MTDQRKDLIFQTPLGDVIKAWREVREITVTELAARAGEPISKGYISEVENNKIRTPNDNYLIRIATALDIPVEYLVMRRLPDETDKQRESEGKQPTRTLPQPKVQPSATDEDKRESAFTFTSPLHSRRQKDDQDEKLRQTSTQIEKQVDNEEEELQEILAQIEELRNRVKKLIRQKGRYR